MWIRPYGFKFYAHVFGCNLDEMDEPNLTTYKSLGDFFYRKLKPGVRPVDVAALVSCPPVSCRGSGADILYHRSVRQMARYCILERLRIRGWNKSKASPIP